MTLTEYTLDLSKKGFDIKYREVTGALKILVTKRSEIRWLLNKNYSTTVYSAEQESKRV